MTIRFETVPYTWYIRFNANGTTGMFYEQQTIAYDESDVQIPAMRTEERLAIAYTPQEVEAIAGAVTVETAKRLEIANAEIARLTGELEAAKETVADRTSMADTLQNSVNQLGATLLQVTAERDQLAGQLGAIKPAEAMPPLSDAGTAEPAPSS